MSDFETDRRVWLLDLDIDVSKLEVASKISAEKHFKKYDVFTSVEGKYVFETGDTGVHFNIGIRF